MNTVLNNKRKGEDLEDQRQSNRQRIELQTHPNYRSSDVFNRCHTIDNEKEEEIPSHDLDVLDEQANRLGLWKNVDYSNYKELCEKVRPILIKTDPELSNFNLQKLIKLSRDPNNHSILSWIAYKLYDIRKGYDYDDFDQLCSLLAFRIENHRSTNLETEKLESISSFVPFSEIPNQAKNITRLTMDGEHEGQFERTDCLDLDVCVNRFL
jgi:hypothetical protein